MGLSDRRNRRWVQTATETANLSTVKRITSVVRVTDLLKRFNARIDRALSPYEDRRSVYSEWVSDIEFDRALHLGAGRDRDGLAQDLESDGEVVAVDTDTDALRQNGTSTRIAGDGQRLPIATDEIDLVFSEYVFEHLQQPRSALAEIDRVLRPGGSFVVLVPNPNHYYARIADLTPFWFHRLWFSLQGIDDYEEERYPTHYEWGTLSDIRNVDGWEVERFTSFTGPTSYTRVLPIHVLFTLFDMAMADCPEYHVCYLVHYRVPA